MSSFSTCVTKVNGSLYRMFFFRAAIIIFEHKFVLAKEKYGKNKNQNFQFIENSIVTS